MRWTWIILSAPLLALSLGCGAGQAKVEAKVETPKPPPPDADGDGVPDDGTDRCLDEKEDHLPPKPDDGCKSSDADGDGIPDDGTDHCLNEQEDGLPPEPKDGCKTTDPDKDGIAGAADKCPEEPETKNGYKDEDGCPDKMPRVHVTKTEVKINEKIMFAFGKATIEKQSDDLLNEIAHVIDDSPQIEFIEVSGHADKIGTDQTNAQLTKQRAQAVLEALAKRGINRRRMRAQGYGRYCPIDTGDSEDAREKNRRVEFKIMKVAGVETGVETGCDEAVAKGIKPAPVPKTAPTKAELEKAREKNGPIPAPAPASGPDAAAAPGAPGKPAPGGKPGAKPPATAKPAAPPKPPATPKPPPPKPAAPKTTAAPKPSGPLAPIKK